MSRDGWLLVRHQGALWGLRRSSVGNLSAALNGSWIELSDGAAVEVDEILTLAPALETRPLPLFAGLFVDAQLDGLAIWQDQPVALLAPDAPLPACFLRSDGEPSTSESPHDA